MTNIPSTPADAKITTWIVPTVADITAITLTEMSGGSVVNLSQYIPAGGWGVNVTEDSINDDREPDSFGRMARGRSKIDSPEVTYIDNTGTALEATANDAADSLAPGSSFVIVRRYGVEWTTDPAATQKYDAFQVSDCGVKQRVPSEANSVLKSKTALYIEAFAQDKAFTA